MYKIIALTLLLSTCFAIDCISSSNCLLCDQRVNFYNENGLFKNNSAKACYNGKKIVAKDISSGVVYDIHINTDHPLGDSQHWYSFTAKFVVEVLVTIILAGTILYVIKYKNTSPKQLIDNMNYQFRRRSLEKKVEF